MDETRRLWPFEHIKKVPFNNIDRPHKVIAKKRDKKEKPQELAAFLFNSEIYRKSIEKENLIKIDLVIYGTKVGFDRLL